MRSISKAFKADPITVVTIAAAFLLCCAIGIFMILPGNMQIAINPIVPISIPQMSQMMMGILVCVGVPVLIGLCVVWTRLEPKVSTWYHHRRMQSHQLRIRHLKEEDSKLMAV